MSKKITVREAISLALSEGFASFSLGAINEIELHRQLCALGVVSRTDLIVKSADEARPNTLSSRHGTGHFPHHTDFAFKPRPPRLIALCNITERLSAGYVNSRSDGSSGRSPSCFSAKRMAASGKGSIVYRVRPVLPGIKFGLSLGHRHVAAGQQRSQDLLGAGPEFSKRFIKADKLATAIRPVHRQLALFARSGWVGCKRRKSSVSPI